MDWIISPLALFLTFWINVVSAIANLVAFILTRNTGHIVACVVATCGAIAVGWVRHEKARRDASPAAFLSSLNKRSQ